MGTFADKARKAAAAAKASSAIEVPKANEISKKEMATGIDMEVIWTASEFSEIQVLRLSHRLLFFTAILSKLNHNYVFCEINSHFAGKESDGDAESSKALDYRREEVSACRGKGRHFHCKEVRRKCNLIISNPLICLRLYLDLQSTRNINNFIGKNDSVLQHYLFDII